MLTVTFSALLSAASNAAGAESDAQSAEDERTLRTQPAATNDPYAKAFAEAQADVWNRITRAREKLAEVRLAATASPLPDGMIPEGHIHRPVYGELARHRVALPHRC